MVSYTIEACGLKAAKLIAKLKAEDKFFLTHIQEDDGVRTIFGNGYLVFIVPFKIGEEKNRETGESAVKLVQSRFWSDDAQRHMQWVPLPRADELKPGRDREHPVRCHLAATDMLAAEWAAENMPCATYPFDVQARYLKMALQLAKFSGQKDTRSAYNPLCLWAEDDEGNVIQAFIMPMRGDGA